MSALAAINAPSWRVSPLSSQWKPADGRVSPLSSQWRPQESAVVTSPVTGEAGADPAASPPTGMIPTETAAPAQPAPAPAPTGQPTQPTTIPGQAPATNYANPAIKWTPDTAPPKAADGRDFVVWGGDKNIGNQKFYVDPVVADGLYGQLKAQQQQLAGAGIRWTAGEKNTDVPDEFVRDMALNLAASGVTSLSDVGKKTVESGVEPLQVGAGGKLYRVQTQGGEGGEQLIPLSQAETANVEERDGQKVLVLKKDVIVNKRTGEPILNQYGGRADASKGVFSGTYQGKGNTGYQVMFDQQGNPYFRTFGASSSDVDKLGPLLTVLSFIPATAPFARIASGLIAADRGNALGAIASFAGAAPGVANMAGFSNSMGALDIGGVAVKDIATGAGLINSIKNNDPLSAIVAGGDMAGLSDIGGVKLDDIRTANNLYRAIDSRRPLAIAAAGWRAMDGVQ